MEPCREDAKGAISGRSMDVDVQLDPGTVMAQLPKITHVIRKYQHVQVVVLASMRSEQRIDAPSTHDATPDVSPTKPFVQFGGSLSGEVHRSSLHT